MTIKWVLTKTDVTWNTEELSYAHREYIHTSYNQTNNTDASIYTDIYTIYTDIYTEESTHINTYIAQHSVRRSVHRARTDRLIGSWQKDASKTHIFLPQHRPR